MKFKKAELVDVMVSKACHSAIPRSSFTHPWPWLVMYSPLFFCHNNPEKVCCSNKKENALPVKSKIKCAQSVKTPLS
jgi:hypothetical protein